MYCRERERERERERDYRGDIQPQKIERERGQQILWRGDVIGLNRTEVEALFKCDSNHKQERGFELKAWKKLWFMQW